jgi:D-alanine-D-alanine ligase
MENKNLKVLVAFNEPNPELYRKPADPKVESLDFVPYFEVENLTPIEEYDLLVGKLRKRGMDASSINIKDNIHSLLNEIKRKRPDVIFNFIEIFRENSRFEMNIVGLFELLRIPYTGASPMALANCQNKVLAKRILNSEGIRTPRFIVFRGHKKSYKHDLSFPLIIKPAYEDASVGIENESIVKNQKELKIRIEYVLHYFAQPVLVEEYIEGRELNVAVIGDKRPRPLPISEIDFSTMPDHLYNIVSYQAKWEPKHEAYHKTIPVCPAPLPKRIENEAKETALKAFKIMGARDYARVDMRLTKDNKLYVLEVNPNPDLTEGAGFMRSAAAARISYVNALLKIIGFAHKRGQEAIGQPASLQFVGK